MLEIKTISYGCTRTDGSYQNVRPEASVELQPGQNPDEVFLELQEYVEGLATRFSTGTAQSEVARLREIKYKLEKDIADYKQRLSVIISHWENAVSAWTELERFAEIQGFQLSASFPRSPFLYQPVDEKLNPEPEEEEFISEESIPY